MAARRGRGVGLSAFTNSTNLRDSFATHGAALRSSDVDSLQTQLSVFQSLLHSFAVQHASTIRQNPTFRAEFARMCNAIGVDPLAGSNLAAKKKSGGSWWGAVLGGDVGDFYLAIAVRVVEVCRETRGDNGGLLAVSECCERVRRGRGLLGGGIQVSDDDILRAVNSLGPLGPGFSVVEIGKKLMVRSVPKALNADQSTVLAATQVLGYVTVSMLEDNLGWEAARAQTVLEDLLADSLLWLDAKAPEKEYWSPSNFDTPDE